MEAWRKSGASWEAGEELWCINMIHSILVYNYQPTQKRFIFPIDNYYLQDYIHHLGVERVSQLWLEQVADYRKAVVWEAGTDSDGCAYKFCKWASE